MSISDGLRMKPVPDVTFLKLAAAAGIAMSLGGRSLLEPITL